MPPSSTPKSTARPTEHRRIYQACMPCRTAKLKCDLGGVDAAPQPPCRRCVRTGRECVFGEAYKRKKRDSTAEHHSESHSMHSSVPGGGQHVPDPSYIASFSTAAPRRKASDRVQEPSEDFRFVRGENLETPADALRILRAAGDGVDTPTRYEIGTSELRSSDTSWNRWSPVREGFLTAEEAGRLLDFYAEHLGPMYPVVAPQLFKPENFGLLLGEPMLLAAIVLVASPYVDLGPSFDQVEPSRAKIVQSKVFGWLVQRMGRIALGDPSMRTIGTVEGFLILSEWPPGASLIGDKLGLGGLPPTRESSACKVLDDVGWMMTGMAVRIAQGLSLDNENTYRNGDTTSWQELRRISTWINCLSADRQQVKPKQWQACIDPQYLGPTGSNFPHPVEYVNAAFALRADPTANISEMSTCWWESVVSVTRDVATADRTRHSSWMNCRVIGELTHLIGLIQDMLYPTPSVTADLVKTGRFESVLHRLKPELDTLWKWHQGDSPPGSPSRDKPIVELWWRIEFDYVRLYGNAIAMRAAQNRALGHRVWIDAAPIFLSRTIQMAEGSFVVEAVDAATSLLRWGIALHRYDVLRYCPGRMFLRLIFASLFLVKAMSFGAISQSEGELVELHYEFIEVLRQASRDEDHVAAQLASLLNRVFPPRPTPTSNWEPDAAVPGPISTDVDPTSANAFDTSMFDFEQLGLPDAWNFDTNSLVPGLDDLFPQLMSNPQGYDYEGVDPLLALPVMSFPNR